MVLNRDQRTEPTGDQGADLSPVVPVVPGLPSAETLRAYEDILEGSADRILSTLERQAEQRMDLERRLVQGAARTERLGQLFGLVIVLFVFVVSTRLITGGHEVSGTLLAIADLAVLVAVYVQRDGDNRDSY
ncbi:MAG: DUF2335 domain-containing protein [Actinomycetes bacterium]